MPHKLPPVPPQQQSPHGAKGQPAKEAEHANTRSDLRNLKEQDQQGNIYQNTHNQGYQQDR
jgi:hypothetical protein